MPRSHQLDLSFQRLVLHSRACSASNLQSLKLKRTQHRFLEEVFSGMRPSRLAPSLVRSLLLLLTSGVSKHRKAKGLEVNRCSVARLRNRLKASQVDSWRVAQTVLDSRRPTHLHSLVDRCLQLVVPSLEELVKALTWVSRAQAPNCIHLVFSTLHHQKRSRSRKTIYFATVLKNDL